MTLPSEERLRDMRASIESRRNGCVFTPITALALLDCALVLRRLEAWLRDGKSRGIAQCFVDESGITLTLGHGDECQFPDAVVMDCPDLLSALKEALDQAEAR